MRLDVRAIFALLVNVYDLAVKNETEIEPDLKISQNIVEKAQDETTIEFYQYLMDIETMEEDALKLAMQKKGLIFM